MKTTKILIYGASGYVGKLFAKEALKFGLKPILAGRGNNISEFAQKMDLESRVFSLDTPSVLIENLKDIAILINLAGPFSATARPLIEACLETKTHYLDIAGEVPEFQLVHSYTQKAQEVGILLLSGAGFGVVPTDLAANLAKENLPNVTHLKIAYSTTGGVSRGTLKTVLKDINKEGVIRINNKLEKAKPAFKEMTFTSQNKKYEAVYNPWRADLFTAGISTSIPNIETYSTFPSPIVSMMKGKLLWLRNFILNNLINLLPEGSSEKELKNGKTIVYVEAKNEKGETSTVEIIGSEAYLFTVQALLFIIKTMQEKKDFPFGFQTPVTAFSTTLLQKIPSLQIKNN
ncbi:saccharopine dehydrogenase NADP-binding domain-containing protein [Bernardetia sp. Wsw4-3y2]|uniref:saccharopine dehydrogenase family protein n=1 Tax=Bernardetia sp. Wsw4-3y2 TaxID=3127471 RepID=UPI0030D148EA